MDYDTSKLVHFTPDLIRIIRHLHQDDRDVDSIYRWVMNNNRNFNGKSPLNLIRDGEAHRVLDYIECVIGAGHPI